MRDGKVRVRSAALLLAMAMSGATVRGAQAADSVGNPAIIDALNKLQASANSLKTAVSGLQDSPLDNETLYSAHCRFTVVSGGTRDAIRGTLAVRSTAKDRLSIPAE